MNVTLVGDIAGQVTEASHDADRITACTVCLPTGALKHIRKRLLGLPKWRNCDDTDVVRAVELLKGEALSVCVLSLAKNVDARALFWSEGAEANKRISNSAKGPIGILRPATLVKFALFGQASTLSVGHAVKIGSVVRPSPRAKYLEVQESHIYDNEIQGAEATEAFADIWRKRNEHQPLANSIGLVLKARTLTLTTEDQEPLLNLPDYAAGVAHARHSAANTLSDSAVSRDCATRAYEKLASSANYIEAVEPFALSYFDIYPSFSPPPRSPNAP